MRLRERHRHVEVRHAGLEARVEDRGVEARVDGVEDGVGARHSRSTRRSRPRSTRRRRRREAAVVELGDDRGRTRGVESASATVLEERSPLRDRAKAEPTPPVPTTRIRTAHGFYTDDLVERFHRRRYAAPGFHRTEVGRERVGHPTEAVHRRRVRRLDVWRDHGGPQPGDRRGDRRGAARDRRGRRACRHRGGEGVGRVAGEDAEGPHGAPARSSPT